MKKGYFRYGLALVLIACLFAFPIGCGSPSDRDTGEGPGPEPEPVPPVEEPVASIASSVSLAMDPTTINVEGTATVTATARDADNDPVPDGTTIIFTVGDSRFGTVTTSSTTSAGIATATFTAANAPGTATINASSGSATGNTTVDILQVPAAAIQFKDANPKVIALAGTGGAEISEIRFIVLDSNNNPLEGINVTFTMDGPNGGEYLVPDSASSDASGIAIVRLYSGDVAGPVTVFGSTDVGDPPTPVTVESTPISIGGGVPSDWFFSISASTRNLPGLGCANETSQIQAWMADRFGNWNVLEGTSVSFAAERGLHVDTAEATLDDKGWVGVGFRTMGGGGADVDPPGAGWEDDLHADILADYGWDAPGYPGDGQVAILVHAKGEEHFDDLNANGLFDAGEFDLDYDTPDDPFIDYNGNGVHDDGSGADPFELYIDADDNGVYDGKNGVWDSNKFIFRNYLFFVSGSPYVLAYVPGGTVDVPNGGQIDINILVCDGNLNQLMPGTTIEITHTVGGLRGATSFVLGDSSAIGLDENQHRARIEYSVQLYDDAPLVTLPTPANGELEVTVVWPDCGDAEAPLTLTGTLYYTVE